MKKYISILSLSAAFFLQSCDRSDLLSNSEEQIFTRGQKPQGKSSVSSFEALNTAEHMEINKFETGDDDEPRKDKSHWRTSNDTIRP
jgi:hypothetical protein